MIDGSPFPQKERYPKAEAAARKALELDDGLAEAHTTLAAENASTWKWKEAEMEFKRAIALNPNYATAHQWYGEYLGQMGNLNEALNEIRRAQELDPLSPIISSTLGAILFQDRQYDRAIAESRKVLDLNPDFEPAWQTIRDCLIAQGKFNELFQEARKRTKNEEQNKQLDIFEQAYRKGGEKEFFREVVKVAQVQANAYELAVIYVHLGENDKAMDHLEKAYADHDGADLPHVNTDIRLAALHDNPRFKELIRKMGFPK